MANDTFVIEENCQHHFHLAPNLVYFFSFWPQRPQNLPLWWQGFCFWVIPIDSRFITGDYCLQQIPGYCKTSLFLLNWQQFWDRFHRDTFHAHIRMDCTKPNESPNSLESSLIVVLQSSSTTECTSSVISWFLLMEGLPEHLSLLTDFCPSLFEPPKPLLNLCTPYCLLPKSLLNCIVGFWAWVPKFYQNLMRICCSTLSVIINATHTTCTIGFGWLPAVVQSEWEAVSQACPQRSKVACTPLSSPSTILLTRRRIWSDTFWSGRILLIIWNLKSMCYFTSVEQLKYFLENNLLLHHSWSFKNIHCNACFKHLKITEGLSVALVWKYMALEFLLLIIT